VLRQRWWGQWGAARIKRFVELLQSDAFSVRYGDDWGSPLDEWLKVEGVIRLFFHEIPPLHGGILCM